MSAKPILHGRDHRPGGADPIPGGSIGAVGTAVMGSGNAFVVASGDPETRVPFYTLASSDTGAISFTKNSGSPPPYDTITLNSDFAHGGAYYFAAGLDVSSEASQFELLIQSSSAILHNAVTSSLIDFSSGSHPGCDLTDYAVVRLQSGTGGSVYVRVQYRGASTRVVNDVQLRVVYVPTADDTFTYP